MSNAWDFPRRSVDGARRVDTLAVACRRGDGVGDGESRRPDCRTLDAIDARCVLRATATSSTACEGATLDAIDATRDSCRLVKGRRNKPPP